MEQRRPTHEPNVSSGAVTEQLAEYPLFSGGAS